MSRLFMVHHAHDVRGAEHVVRQVGEWRAKVPHEADLEVWLVLAFGVSVPPEARRALESELAGKQWVILFPNLTAQTPDDALFAAYERACEWLEDLHTEEETTLLSADLFSPESKLRELLSAAVPISKMRKHYAARRDSGGFTAGVNK